MAKASGLGWTTLSVTDTTPAARDIRNDITELNFATPRAVADVTGIDKSAHERLLLLADYSIDMKGVFNAAANYSHSVFSTIPSYTGANVNRTITCVVNGATLSPIVVLTDYTLTRAASGEITWAVPGALADGATPTWS